MNRNRLLSEKALKKDFTAKYGKRKCKNCDREIPGTIQPGSDCPYCHKYWSAKEEGMSRKFDSEVVSEGVISYEHKFISDLRIDTQGQDKYLLYKKSKGSRRGWSKPNLSKDELNLILKNEYNTSMDDFKKVKSQRSEMFGVDTLYVDYIGGRYEVYVNVDGRQHTIFTARDKSEVERKAKSRFKANYKIVYVESINNIEALVKKILSGRGIRQSFQEMYGEQEIPAEVDFRSVKGEDTYKRGTEEFDVLEAMDAEQWRHYIDTMTADGIEVEYNDVLDVYTVSR